MPAEDTNTRDRQLYGQRQLARAYAPSIPDRLSWTPWEGIGPGAEVHGDVTGRQVLDFCSGAGHHAVHGAAGTTNQKGHDMARAVFTAAPTVRS